LGNDDVDDHHHHGNNENAAQSVSNANETNVPYQKDLSSFDTSSSSSSIPISSTQNAAFSPLDLNKIKSIALTQGCFGLLTVSSYNFKIHLTDMTLIYIFLNTTLQW
jgi:hypothetical protein